jgi:hypothetical protein
MAKQTLGNKLRGGKQSTLSQKIAKLVGKQVNQATLSLEDAASLRAFFYYVGKVGCTIFQVAPGEMFAGIDVVTHRIRGAAGHTVEDAVRAINEQVQTAGEIEID